MDPTIRALLLTSAAGLSTMLGALVIFITKEKNEKLIVIGMSFAAGVMISVSFSELLPNAQDAFAGWAGERWSVVLMVAFLALGILLTALLDYLLPEEQPQLAGEYENLHRVGWISTLAIGLHNFPEGIATFMAGYESASLGVAIAIAIALHNIPEGITVAMPCYYATGSRWKALKYTFYSGIAEPLGALVAFLLLRPFLNGFMLGGMFGLVSGIMLYIAMEELIPAYRQYGYERLGVIAIFAGICLMPLTQMM